MKSKKEVFIVGTNIVNRNYNYGTNDLLRNIIECPVVLIRGTNEFLENFASNGTYKDRKGLCDKEEHITVLICPVYYGLINNLDCSLTQYKPFVNCTLTQLTQCRHFAVTNLYQRWSEFTNNHNTKECYASKKFNRFLEKIEYTKTDYVVFRLD